MGFCVVLVFLALLQLAWSQSTYYPPPPPPDVSDIEAAMEDLREKAYDGFVMLLKMMNYSDVSSTQSGVTFLVPTDEVLSEYSVSPADLEHFVLGHVIQTFLPFKNMLNFPTGTMIPSGLEGEMFTITNGGKWNFSVNNAKVIAPNVCSRSSISCHGIDAVIQFDHHSSSASAPSVASEPMPPHSRLKRTISGDIDKRASSQSSDATPHMQLTTSHSSEVAHHGQLKRVSLLP